MAEQRAVTQGSAARSGEHCRPVRQKVAVACDECRSRKSKCDGIRPSESVSLDETRAGSGIESLASNFCHEP